MNCLFVPIRSRTLLPIAAKLVTLAWLLASPTLADPPASVTYEYDDLGRLRTGVLSDGRVVDYQYDPAGNRTSMTSGIPAQISISAAASVTEGGVLMFPVTRTGATLQNVTVDCVPQDGTARANGAPPFDDYVVDPQQLTFLAADPSPITKNCAISTKTDSYYEGSQTLTAVLQNSTAGAVIATSSAVGAILDASSSPAFSVAGQASAEGTAITFTILRSGLTELAHNVSYSTADGSATQSDADYAAVGWTSVAFASDISSVAVSVSTTADTKFEGDESVTVNLASATNGATIASSSGSGTIVNDDAAPAITISDPVAANEGAAIRFVVRNVGNTNTAFNHSISWSTADGTAVAGADYDASSGTVALGPGETLKTFDIQARVDGIYEGANETFFANLSSNASTFGAILQDPQGIGTIADIDVAVPSTPTSLRVSSGSTPNYTVQWNASTGPISYYVLEEATFNGPFSGSYTVNAPTVSKSFTSKPSGEYRYRVKACSASNQCSGYSNEIYRLVCNPRCD